MAVPNPATAEVWMNFFRFIFSPIEKDLKLPTFQVIIEAANLI